MLRALREEDREELRVWCRAEVQWRVGIMLGIDHTALSKAVNGYPVSDRTRGRIAAALAKRRAQ